MSNLFSTVLFETKIHSQSIKAQSRQDVYPLISELYTVEHVNRVISEKQIRLMNSRHNPAEYTKRLLLL